jgi:glycosyltransferase involved in cell wall biosynthesis
MITDSLVSVIIPAYNAEPQIAQTLKSVLAQTYQQFEIIVVDDGSTDRTADVVRSLQAIDPRIQLIQQRNAGVSAARNAAIAQARGEYLAPLDADDVWLPPMLERCIERLNKGVGVAYAWSVDIDAAGNILGRYAPVSSPEGRVLLPLICAQFLKNGSSAVFRRDCIEKVGGYNPQQRSRQLESCEEWDLLLRIADKYEFGCVPEFLVGYRQAGLGRSQQIQRVARGYELMMADVRQRHPEIPRRVFRWSAGLFYNYLAEKSGAAANYGGMLRWFFRGVRSDRALLLQPGVYKAMPLALVRLIVFTLLRHRPTARVQPTTGIPLREVARVVDTPLALPPYHRVLRSRQMQLDNFFLAGR